MFKGHSVWSTNYWGHQFKIEFDVKVTQNLTDSYHSILHITKGGSSGQYGDRIPAIWAHKAKKFYICSAYNGNTNYCKTPIYQLNQWYHFEIEQTKNSYGFLVYRIKIDNSIIEEMVNAVSAKFKNLDLYLSSPWNKSLRSFGQLKNLKIVNLENCHAYSKKFE